MVSTKSLFVAAFAAAFAAVVPVASACGPTVTPTLPQTGEGMSANGELNYILTDDGKGTELGAPAASLVLKNIAIGHGIQNYSCVDATGDPSATGALAVLYDATGLYPGTARTGISQQIWDDLPSHLLWNKPLPLNKLASSKYGANGANPFPPPANLRLRGLPTIDFLGHHYFDPGSIPTFDLSAAGLKASVKKLNGINAPSYADKGIVGSGAVQWLQLGDSGNGHSRGLSMVYRVATAGGVAQACLVTGVGVQSVPYTAFYWFYG